MHPPGADVVLVRHGDIGVKSPPVQRRMENTLRDNLSAMIDSRGIEGVVERDWGRLFLYVTEDTVEAATDAASDTFGVISASPATAVRPTMGSICDALVTTAVEYYHDGTFAVRARRAGTKDAHPFSSQDIEQIGGNSIWEAVSGRFDPAVDLETPDITFYVECRSDTAYVFLEKRPGPGGFPVGTQGRVVALVSGGFDSPVAAWEMMKRGCSVVPVYFDFETYGGQDHVARAVEICRKLASFAPGGDHHLWVVPGGEVAELLIQELDGTRMLSLRRFMFRVAEKIAYNVNAHGIVTGEALGQKSSQTGPNLAVTDAATTLPIYRPLLTCDKQVIIDRSKEIGTHFDSTIPAGCNRIAPAYPDTNASRSAVEAMEPDELDDCFERAIDEVELVHLERQSALV